MRRNAHYLLTINMSVSCSCGDSHWVHYYNLLLHGYMCMIYRLASLIVAFIERALKQNQSP